LQLRFEHRKVAVDHGGVITAHKSGPGIDTHDIADIMAVHVRGASDRDLVHAIGHLPLHTKDLLNRLGI
jgi:hypothetical protein